MSVEKERWEKAFGAGAWARLRDDTEAGRYALLAGLLKRYWRGGPILDVGSGESILADFLHPEVVAAYIGLDLAETALCKAKRERPSIPLVCAALDALPFRSGSITLLLFNEVLYYAHNPVGVLEACCRCLKEAGLVVLSTFQPGASDAPWQLELDRLWQELEKPPWSRLAVWTLENAEGMTWKVAVLRRS